MSEKINEDEVLENTSIEEKIQAGRKSPPLVTARKFIQESIDISQLLPPQKRMLFAMYYSHNLTKTDIAKVCNCTPGAVGVRLSKISEEINGIRNCMKDGKDGETNKSTKARIEAYFRGQKARARST